MKEEIAKREWEKHFGDEKEFLDKYFATYYQDQNLIINTENLEDEFIYMGLIVKYNYKYHNSNIPIGYVTAVLVSLEHRGKGYFTFAMQNIFKELIKQDYALSCLIPATQKLTDTYLKYGYANCFVKEKNPNHHKAIVHEQKTIDLYEELEYDISTLKPCHNGMLRIIDVEKILTHYAHYHPEQEITYKIIDKQIEKNNKIMELKQGKVKEVATSKTYQEITISELAKQIFDKSYMDLMFDQ